MRRAPLPDPLFLWVQYRKIHDLIKPRQGVSRSVLEDALHPEWIRCGASGKVPDSVFKTLRTSPRSTGARKAAVEFVSKAYGAKPHTLPAIFRRAGYQLRDVNVKDPLRQTMWRRKRTQEARSNS